MESEMAEKKASLEYAARMDAQDPMQQFRDRFHFPQRADGGEILYFTGNSLGLQPRMARGYIEQELDDWARLAVAGHIHAKTPWLPYHEFLTEKMARVVGAMPIETVVMNSLTVNLHLMMVSFYRPQGERRKVMIEKGAFPSDQYAVRSQIAFHGFDPESCLLEIEPRKGESTLRTGDILEAIEREGESIALILMGGVNYLTGQAFEMRSISKAGRRAGAKVGFDLAHAAGNLELHLHDWDVDFAVWCSYKYLNAGPGGIAGAFINERHARSFDLPRFAGWWGNDKETRFLMGPEFKPLAGAEGWQISNPPIFQMAALRASLDIFDEAGMKELRSKSVKLTGYLESLITGLNDDRVTIITPREPETRGCQLSIRVRDAGKKVFDHLTANGAEVDWREPDVIRVTPVPLYNSFKDVYLFSEMFRTALG